MLLDSCRRSNEDIDYSDIPTLDEDFKLEIKALSAQAALLSQKATVAFKNQDFHQGKKLMAQAVVASKDCQKLLLEYTKQVGVNEKV